MQKKPLMPNLFFLVTILAVVFLVYFAKERNRTPMSIQISPESPQENWQHCSTQKQI